MRKPVFFFPDHLGFVCPECVEPCSGAILWLQWCYCAPGHGSAWRKVLDPCPVLWSLPYLIWQWFSSAGCPALKCAVLTPFSDMEKESLQSSSLHSVLLYIESAGIIPACCCVWDQGVLTGKKNPNQSQGFLCVLLLWAWTWMGKAEERESL